MEKECDEIYEYETEIILAKCNAEELKLEAKCYTQIQLQDELIAKIEFVNSQLSRYHQS